jgi:hypothetical protein
LKIVLEVIAENPALLPQSMARIVSEVRRGAPLYERAFFRRTSAGDASSTLLFTQEAMGDSHQRNWLIVSRDYENLPIALMSKR